MPIIRRVTVRRLLGSGAAALTLTAVTGGAAWASDAPGGHGWNKGDRGGYASGKGPGTVTEADRCQFSLDGTTFTDSVRVDDQNLRPTEDGKVHIKVRAAGDATTCTASLSSYLAHGASFNTSGLQVFHDFDSVTVKRGETDSLDISVPDAGCFAQVDLYRGKVKFDGKLDANDGFEHGDVPKGPDRPVIKDKLIAAWNGGTKDCTADSPSTPAETVEPTASAPAPDASESATTAPESSPATTASPDASATPSSSTSISASPADESSAPAGVTPDGGSSTPSGDLAETGGGNALPIAAGAAALLAAGVGIAVATRRRASGTRV